MLFPTIIIILTLLGIYILWRNEKVYRFRLSIIDKCHDNCFNYHGPFDSSYCEYRSVTYNTMLFSIKSLKEENFYSEDFCKFLNS